MQLKVSVISDRPDEYIGKKGLVKNQVITCLDVDPSGYRLLMPFDYTLNEDEKTKWAGKLQDKQIVIGVRELMPFGGRLRARGAIVTGPDGSTGRQLIGRCSRRATLASDERGGIRAARPAIWRPMFTPRSFLAIHRRFGPAEAPGNRAFGTEARYARSIRAPNWNGGVAGRSPTGETGPEPPEKIAR